MAEHILNALAALVAAAAWAYLGIRSFVYWWTKEFDLTDHQKPLMVMAALMGPIEFFVGWIVHGDSLFKPAGKVLKKQRARKP